MADGIRFREGIKIEYERFKTLKGKEKWVQFREYYLGKSILLILALLIGISFVSSFLLSRRDVLISGALINTSISQEGERYLSEEYFAKQEASAIRQRIELSSTRWIDFGAEKISYENSNEWTGVYAQIAAKDLDYMIVDQSAYEIFCNENICAKIADILPENTQEQLFEQIIDNQAIRLETSILAKDYGLPSENVYLIFVVNGKNLKEADSFVKYIFRI